MDPLYSSGGPAVSSYTSISYPGANLHPDSMSFLVKQHLLPSDTCYTPTACHPLSQDLDLELPPAAAGSSCSYSSDTRIHMTPASSSSSSLSHQHRSSDDQVWPSPPLDPRDIHSVSFQDSPLSVGSIPLPCYSNSPVSPAAWSSPTLSFLPPHGLPLFQHQQQQQQPVAEVDSPAYFHICTPTSSHDFPLGGVSDLPTTPYVGGFHQKRQESSESETAGRDQSFRRRLHHRQRNSHFASTPSPIMAAASLPRQPPTSVSSNTHSSPEGQLCGSLPATAPTSIQADAVKEEVAVKRESGNEETPARGLVKSHTFPIVASPDAANPGKTREPYAQLIYKALMSQPDHRMSLQDIYQWFRENTDRASDENGGWQNSIRHNLSMNKAFTKCDQKQAADGPAPSLATADSGEARSQTQQASSSASRDLKRVNEWVLEKSAVLDGVESTTRFRKKSSGRRAAARYTSHPDSVSVVGGRRSNTDHIGNNMSSQQQQQQQQQRQHSSIRALSGRKGGCATKSSSRFRGQRCGSVGRSSYGSPMRRSQYQQQQQQQQHDAMMHQGRPDSPLGSGAAGVVVVSNPYFPVLPLSRVGSASLHASPSCSSSSSSSMMAQIHDDGSGYSPETTDSPLFSFGLAVQGLADPGPGPGRPGPGHGHGHGNGGSGGRGVSGIGGAGFHHHHEEGGSGSETSTGTGTGTGASASMSMSMNMSMNMNMNMSMYEYLTPSPVGEFPFGIADVQVPVQMDYSVNNWSQHHGL